MNKKEKEKTYYHKKTFNDKKTQQAWNTLNKINMKFPYTMLQYSKRVLESSGYRIE